MQSVQVRHIVGSPVELEYICSRMIELWLLKIFQTIRLNELQIFYGYSEKTYNWAVLHEKRQRTLR